jgi:hypothetical protein
MKTCEPALPTKLNGLSVTVIRSSSTVSVNTKRRRSGGSYLSAETAQRANSTKCIVNGDSNECYQSFTVKRTATPPFKLMEATKCIVNGDSNECYCYQSFTVKRTATPPFKLRQKQHKEQIKLE